MDSQYKAIQEEMLAEACDRLRDAMARQYHAPIHTIEHKGKTLLVKVTK